MNNQPIGVMDSGLGGLTAVKALREQLPNESIMYIADTARLPYGPRTAEEVAEFVVQIGHYLEAHDAKLLLIACNTATVAGLAKAQEQLSIPVVGMIHPGSTKAVIESQTHHYIVFATEGTVKSHAYQTMITSLDKQAMVTEVACPSFVTLVEQGQWSGSMIDIAVREAFEQVDDPKVDTLILGCTHFPLLSEAIHKGSPVPLKLINPGEASISEVYHILEKKDLLSDEQANYSFYTTGDTEGFEHFIGKVLSLQNVSVKHIDIEELKKYGD